MNEKVEKRENWYKGGWDQRAVCGFADRVEQYQKGLSPLPSHQAFELIYSSEHFIDPTTGRMIFSHHPEIQADNTLGLDPIKVFMGVLPSHNPNPGIVEANYLHTEGTKWVAKTPLLIDTNGAAQILQTCARFGNIPLAAVAQILDNYSNRTIWVSGNAKNKPAKAASALRETLLVLNASPKPPEPTGPEKDLTRTKQLAAVAIHTKEALNGQNFQIQKVRDLNVERIQVASNEEHLYFPGTGNLTSEPPKLEPLQLAIAVINGDFADPWVNKPSGWERVYASYAHFAGNGLIEAKTYLSMNIQYAAGLLKRCFKEAGLGEDLIKPTLYSYLDQIRFLPKASQLNYRYGIAKHLAGIL